ncbi:MAG: hypothetical protein MK098_03280 [Marinovum sp.]|nr:hypothetical protein [Marinovum sp.]
MLRTTSLALALVGAAAAPAIAQEKIAPAEGIVSSQLGIELTPLLVVGGVSVATIIVTQAANESSGTD